MYSRGGAFKSAPPSTILLGTLDNNIRPLTLIAWCWGGSKKIWANKKLKGGAADAPPQPIQG